VLIFNRGKIGLSISAGVENRGMVDALGPAVIRRCVHVGFGAGSARRTDVALLRPSFTARWGLVVISTIIDNLGLVGEWFIASILVALIGPAFSSLSLP
jgi:hypothetical protein